MIEQLKHILGLDQHSDVGRMTEQQRYDYYYQACSHDGKLVWAGTLLQRAASLFANSKAILSNDHSITYKELYWRSLLLTHKLQKMGVSQRDRVIVMFENSIEFYVAYYGAWQTGAIVAPLNVFLHEKEVAHIVQSAQPKIILCSDKFVSFFANAGVPVLSEKDLDQEPMPDAIPAYTIPALPSDELTILLYTSGTTGEPKGVMLSSNNILYGILQAASRIKVTKDVRVFAVLPLFHSFAQTACVWAPMVVGATIIVVQKIDRRHILNSLRHKPTIFLGVPSLYGILCLFKYAKLASVDYFICGGDALPDKIRAAFELVYRRKLCNGYGLTESAPTISLELEDEFVTTNCIGRPVMNIEISLRDEDGKPVPPRTIGVLWAKGPNVMLGYYKLPEMTASVLKDGWLNTGDYAYQDAEGRLYISGRQKDLIINKGVNIFPSEIENVLLTHPAVLLAAVVGKSTEEGEIPVAFVSLRHPTPNVEKELLDLCQRNLATYKIPRQFIILESMPVTAVGKIDKKALRAQLKSS